MSEKYTVKRYEKLIGMDVLMEKYYNFEDTHSKCKECPGYCTTWSCPEFDFAPEDFWGRFKSLRFIVDVIDNSNASTVEEAQDWLFTEKHRYDKELREMEADVPGSYGMAAQECQECTRCARLSGHACVHPDRMRYGLEALGMLPTEMVPGEFGFPIVWSDGESVPDYYVLAAGVLLP